MKDKKIKILVVPSDMGGVGFFRSIWPHLYIQEHYREEFDIDVIYVKDFPTNNLTDFFKQYDIIHVHKQLDSELKVMNLLKFLDIPIVLDLDDSYELGPDHPLYITSEKENWKGNILNHVKLATYVTTTTPIFASNLRKYNKNVRVFPNAINPDDEQFKVVKNPSKRIRFGIVCGSTHMKDLELMRKSINNLPQKIKDKMQIVLCGFDTNGQTTIYNSDGTVEVRPIQPEESLWCRYEELLTNNYKDVSQEHKEFLKQYAVQKEDPFDDEFYRRYWTKDIQHYAQHYANVDVLLAPLKINVFNERKSELKEIECGFTDTALIASKYGPYTINLVPYLEKHQRINENGTALLVRSSENDKMWAKSIIYLVEHPEAIENLKNNLKKFVQENYSMEKVCKDRVEFYREIIKNKEEETELS